MNKNSEILLNSLIIGVVLYLLFKYLIRFKEESSQSGAIVIACISCIYLVSTNELKK